MPKTTQNGVLRALPMVATVLVVVGVVVVAKLAPPSAAPTSSPTTKGPTTATVLVSQSGATLTIRTSGDQLKETSCDLPSGYVTVDRITNEGIIVRSATGSRATLDFSCGAVSSTPPLAGTVNRSGNRGAWLDRPRSDGAGDLLITRSNRTEEVTLRGKNSRPYRDAQVVGWADDDHIFVVAFRNGERYLLLVAATGSITELEGLSENATEFRVGDGTFYYVTVTPGEGLESGPTGPSELHRVQWTGLDDVRVTVKDGVIEQLTVSDAGDIAFQVGGALWWYPTWDAERSDEMNGLILGWTNEGGLLVLRDGGQIVELTNGGSRVLSAQAPSDTSAAWAMQIELDAAATTE